MTDMRKFVLRITALGILGASLIVACSKNEEQPPPAQPGQYQSYPPGTAPAQQPYPQQQPGYPAQPQAGYPAQPQPYPAAPAPAAAPAPTAGATSTPSAVAFPCQADVQCLSHRCNLQVGKCAWPCQSNDDCQPGFQCVSPACVPVLPAQ
jgi:hypothetical protein